MLEYERLTDEYSDLEDYVSQKFPDIDLDLKGNITKLHDGRPVSFVPFYVKDEDGEFVEGEYLSEDRDAISVRRLVRDKAHYRVNDSMGAILHIAMQNEIQGVSDDISKNRERGIRLFGEDYLVALNALVEKSLLKMDEVEAFFVRGASALQLINKNGELQWFQHVFTGNRMLVRGREPVVQDSKVFLYQALAQTFEQQHIIPKTWQDLPASYQKLFRETKDRATLLWACVDMGMSPEEIISDDAESGLYNDPELQDIFDMSGYMHKHGPLLLNVIRDIYDPLHRVAKWEGKSNRYTIPKGATSYPIVQDILKENYGIPKVHKKPVKVTRRTGIPIVVFNSLPERIIRSFKSLSEEQASAIVEMYNGILVNDIKAAMLHNVQEEVVVDLYDELGIPQVV